MKEQNQYNELEGIRHGQIGAGDFGACIGERLCLDDVLDGPPEESGGLIRFGVRV
jgi:hypothetical protein